MDDLDRREFLIRSALLTGAFATKPSLPQGSNPTPHHSTPAMPDMSEVMREMEHPKVTTFVPPLVDERVHMRFCQAVQSYANGQGNAVGRLSHHRSGAM